MKTAALLDGPDRLQHSELLGRPIRSGSPTTLSAVSDKQRALDLMTGGQIPEAIEFLTYLLVLHNQMLDMGIELVFRWAEYLTRNCSQEEAKGAIQEVVDKCKSWREALTDQEASDEKEILEQCLSPRQLTLDSLDEFLSARDSNDHVGIRSMLLVPKETQATVVAFLQERRLEDAQQAFIRYFQQVRCRHDHLIRLIWAFSSTVLKRSGQKRSAQAFRQVFTSCSFDEPALSLFESLPPDHLAALLAEHLRSHFSGSNRDGLVEIVEETDRYRLVFDPCGSGGALRRVLADQPVPGFDCYPDGSPQTWGIAGKVPSYCAHCAINEAKFVERAGHLVWVTEFDPNPMAPCGWTVYKEHGSIPSRYYDRIGADCPI